MYCVQGHVGTFQGKLFIMFFKERLFIVFWYRHSEEDESDGRWQKLNQIVYWSSMDAKSKLETNGGNKKIEKSLQKVIQEHYTMQSGHCLRWLNIEA